MRSLSRVSASCSALSCARRALLAVSSRPRSAERPGSTARMCSCRRAEHRRTSCGVPVLAWHGAGRAYAGWLSKKRCSCCRASTSCLPWLMSCWLRLMTPT